MLSLLRAVRDVLTRVDGTSAEVHPYLQKEIVQFPKRMKQSQPEPRIYWEFICDDANGILHYYEFSAVQSVIFRCVESGEPISIARTSATNPAPANPLPENSYTTERTYLMKTGPFTGQDQRVVVLRAIEWWTDEIEQMELRAAARAYEDRRSAATDMHSEPD